MSVSKIGQRNDQYACIDEAAPQLLKASRELVENGEASRVSDEAVAQIMTAAIRLYVAKSDGEERTFSPIARQLLRALHLGPTELALLYRHVDPGPRKKRLLP